MKKVNTILREATNETLLYSYDKEQWCDFDQNYKKFCALMQESKTAWY